MARDTNEYHPSMPQSLKSKYLLVALGVGAGLSLLLGGVAYYEHRIDTADISRLTYATVEQKLQSDLEVRANSVGEMTGSLLAPALAAHNEAAIAPTAGRLLEESDIERVEVRDARGTVLFSGANPQDTDGVDSAAQIGPATLEPLILTKAIPAVTTAQGAHGGGTLKVWVSRSRMQATLAGLHAQLEHQQGSQLKRMRGFLARITLPLVAFGLLGAWFVARQLSRPIFALIRSADRIGEGDYTSPLHVARRDELGELQQALERMRQKLSETTITKNYLDTVLNSLSDAVIVTSPDGLIKSCNQATQALLGYSEDELIGKSLVSFIDEPHRGSFDLATAAAAGCRGGPRDRAAHAPAGRPSRCRSPARRIDSDDPQFQGDIYVARNITERKRAERRIRYLARYDALTKMPNRMQFQHLLQQAIARARRNEQVAGAAVPRHGPLQGGQRHLRPRAPATACSEMLSRAADAGARKDTVIGRLAGDEFALFVDGLPIDADNRPA